MYQLPYPTKRTRWTNRTPGTPPSGRRIPPTIGRVAAPYAVSLAVAAIADLSWAVTR